jgi:hypothetical protein
MHLFPVATNPPFAAAREVNAYSLGYSARFLPLAPGGSASGTLLASPRRHGRTLRRSPPPRTP